MGLPFNSAGDDFGITFAGAREEGFFTSNRGQKKGYDLIYSFVLPEMEILIEGKLLSSDGEHLTEGNLRLVGNDGTNVKMQVRRDGTYRLKLNKQTQYAMLANALGLWAGRGIACAMHRPLPRVSLLHILLVLDALFRYHA